MKFRLAGSENGQLVYAAPDEPLSKAPSPSCRPAETELAAGPAAAPACMCSMHGKRQRER